MAKHINFILQNDNTWVTEQWDISGQENGLLLKLTVDTNSHLMPSINCLYGHIKKDIKFNIEGASSNFIFIVKNGPTIRLRTIRDFMKHGMDACSHRVRFTDIRCADFDFQLALIDMKKWSLNAK